MIVKVPRRSSQSSLPWRGRFGSSILNGATVNRDGPPGKRPLEKDCEVQLIREIAAMVDLGRQNDAAAPKGANTPDPHRRSIGVVAGGTQPPLPNRRFVALDY